MTSIATVERKKREKHMLFLFEELYETIEQPISASLFAERAKGRFEHLYKETSLHAVLKKMAKQGDIQRVYIKNSLVFLNLYVPKHLEISYRHREWETEEERETRKQALLENANVTEEDYVFLLTMIASEKLPTHRHRQRMPLLKAIQQKNHDYEKFVSLIRPYLNHLSEKTKAVVTMRLGINHVQAKTIDEIGDMMKVGQTRVKELWKKGMNQVESLMEKTINV